MTTLAPEALQTHVNEPPRTSYVVYVLPKGKRTWERRLITDEHQLASRESSLSHRAGAREVATLRFWPEQTWGAPSIVSTGDWPAFIADVHRRRAYPYSEEAERLIATMEYGDIECEQHDGLLYALRAALRESPRLVVAWSSTTTHFLVYSGLPEGYRFGLHERR